MGLAYLCSGLVVIPVLVRRQGLQHAPDRHVDQGLRVLSVQPGDGPALVRPADWWASSAGSASSAPCPSATDTAARRLSMRLRITSITEPGRSSRWPTSRCSAGSPVTRAAAGWATRSTATSCETKAGAWATASARSPARSAGGTITLSHLGKVFPLNGENLRKWKGWWRYILVDQVLHLGPGCFVGMGLPAPMSLRFAPHSTLYGHGANL